MEAINGPVGRHGLIMIFRQFTKIWLVSVADTVLPGKTGLAEYGLKVMQKIGGKLAEYRWKIGRNSKHVGGKTANGSHA